MRKWIIFGLVIAGLIGISRCSDDSKPAPSTEQAPASQPASSQEPAKQSSKWSYNKEEDKMRGTASYTADISSDNFINQDFPYNGDVHLNMRFQRTADGRNGVVFFIDKGQIPCYDNGDSCHFKIKIDNGPVRSVRATGAANGRSDAIFVEGNLKKFASDIRKAKKVIVEVSLYQAGDKQFTFSPEGMDWKHF